MTSNPLPTYTTVTTEWSLFTVDQARNFGPDVIAGRCEWSDYGHNHYDGMIRARSTANDDPSDSVTTPLRKRS